MRTPKRPLDLAVRKKHWGLLRAKLWKFKWGVDKIAVGWDVNSDKPRQRRKTPLSVTSVVEGRWPKEEVIIRVRIFYLCFSGRKGAGEERCVRENNPCYVSSPLLDMAFHPVSPSPVYLAQCLASNRCFVKELNDTRQDFGEPEIESCEGEVFCPSLLWKKPRQMFKCPLQIVWRRYPWIILVLGLLLILCSRARKW